MIKNILSIIGILVICTLFMGAVSAADWTVNPGDSIQSAINNASNNDTIIVNDNNGTAYTYTENLVINKTLQLKTINGTNVTIQALNPSKSIIMVYNGGSGSIIQGLTITGATNYVGIYLNQSSNCNITGNKITNNYHGIYLYKAYNTLITQNTLINNVKDGICVVNSTVNVKFNIISGNTRYGLFVLNNGNANATNNWWGKNIPNYICSTSWPSTCDIWNQNCIVNYDPWLNLTITAPDTIHTGEDYSITADLTKDKNGNDTSSQGNIPDGIPVNFTTIIGNISTPVSTRNGKAMATLNSALKGPTLVSVNLNGQTVNKTVNILGVLNERTNEWFNTIQAAINDTDTLNDDTIILSEGTYTENIIINKKLTIKGISEGNVTIKALNSSKTVLTVNSTGNGSTIQYLTITGQTNMPVIFLDSADNCIITGNIVTNSTSHGIQLVNSNNSTISDNTITNHSWYGIYSSSSHNNTISGNTFTNDLDGIHLCGGEGNKITRNNMDDGNFGIYLYETTNCTVTNNTATNMQQNGIYLENSNYTILSENTFKYNTQNGICIRYSSNNRIIDNDITDNTYHGIYLHYSNGINIITGNKIKNNDLNGITLYYSSADINYNIITGNTKYGLYK